MTTRKRYKIALIEPSDIICAGIKYMLSATDEFDIVSTSADLRQWSSAPKASSADIILINPSVADHHGRSNIRQLLSARPEIALAALVYSYFSQDELNQYDCVVDIDDAKDDIAKKLRRAAENKSDTETVRDSAELSDREKEILTSLVEGHTNKEIASIYNLSVHTVISHRKNISRKTGIKTVSGLTVYALLNNLVKADDVE